MPEDKASLVEDFLASRDGEDDDTHAVRILEVTRLAHQAWWYATAVWVTLARRPSRRVTVNALADGAVGWPKSDTPEALAAFRGNNGQSWPQVAGPIAEHLSALAAGFDEPRRLGWQPMGRGRWRVPLLDRRAGRALIAVEATALLRTRVAERTR